MTRNLHPLRKRAAVLVAAVLLAGTARADYYEDALRRFDRGDLNGAVVQLKNALQQNPRLLPAQVLLADAYLRLGMSAAAEAALDTAAQLGADRAVLAPRLAQALRGQFKFQDLLRRVQPTGLPPPVAAEVLIERAAAHTGLGEFRQAAQSLDEAARLDPRAARVHVAQGTLRLKQGDLKGATASAQRALELDRGDAHAWNLRGSIAHVRGDVAGALEDYAQALGLDPEHLDARLARAGLLMDAQRHNEAEADLAVLRRLAPGDPRAAYLFALAAARRGDAEATRAALALVTEVLDRIPAQAIKGNAQLLMLGGLAHFGLGQPGKARGYLQSYVTLEPRHPGARKLLAAILLEERDYKRVIELLSPFAGASAPDPQLLTLLATAYMGRKQYQLATDLFEQAARLAPDLADGALGLGMSHIVAGRAGQGMALLRELFDKDPGQIRAGMLLATTHLNRGESRQALAIARRMAEREPENLSVLDLLGRALLAEKDAAGARQAFTRAARLQRNFLPAQVNLARLDVAEGRLAQARTRLEAILKASPGHGDALLELARLDQRTGKRDDAIRRLERARVNRATPLPPLLYLVELHLEAGNAKSALDVAMDLDGRHADHPAVMDALGRAYAAGGDFDKARVTFARMSRQAGFDAARLTHIAGLMLRIGALDDARAALDKALSADPNDVAAQHLRVELDLRAGRHDAAEKRARELRARQGDAASAALFGRVLMARNKPAAAVPEFRAALTAQPGGAHTLALFQALLAAGDGDAAIALMRDWLRDNSHDVAAEAALAEAHLRLGKWSEARDAYQRYLEKRPNDVGALNNLANVLLRLDDPRALTVARQAHALAPADPDVADTLGWILVRRGEPAQALPYLRDARLRAPANAQIQYHLGVALHQLGRKAEARRELHGALAAPGGFEGRDEARALLGRP
jgi:putative PEP-CTERM system TPR-repeat lipoprotein